MSYKGMIRFYEDSESEKKENGTNNYSYCKAIADVKGIEHPQLELILENYFDMNALEALYDHKSSSGTLSFEIPEHTVTVVSDGTVFVDGTKEIAEV